MMKRYPQSAATRRSKAPSSVWCVVDIRDGSLSFVVTNPKEATHDMGGYEKLYEYCRSGRSLTRQQAKEKP